MNQSKPSADDPAPAPPGELAPAPASGTAVTPTAPQARHRVRWVLIGLLFLGLVGAGARAVWMHMAARADLARAKAALDADDVKAARDILDRCLLNSPNNAGAHFRMAQAARRAGDVRSAEDHLDRAEALGWDPGAIELERAVARAQGGDLESVESVLVQSVQEGHPESAHILAFLVPALMTEFRWIEANALAERWVALQPGSARAWANRGAIFERLRKKDDAVNAYREAVRLDPADRRTRYNLARMILETRGPPDEAAGHLETLLGLDPDSPTLAIQLAVCREAQGRPGEAAELLDAVIAHSAPDARAYYHRGRLEMNRDRSAGALPFLRRAAELDPSDVETLHALFTCLSRVGTPAEVREAEERWKRAEADLKRVAELGRAIAGSPHDPDLRREMGELFLRNSRPREGVRWLESALRERPDHVPTHRILANFYEQSGQPQLAAHHRALAEPGPMKEK